MTINGSYRRFNLLFGMSVRWSEPMLYNTPLNKIKNIAVALPINAQSTNL